MINKFFVIFITFFCFQSISFANTNQKDIELNFLNQLVSAQYLSQDKVPEITEKIILKNPSNVASNSATDSSSDFSFSFKSLFTVPNLLKLVGTLLFLYTFRGILIIVVQKFGLIFGKIPMFVYQLLVGSLVGYLLYNPSYFSFIESFWTTLFAANALILVFAWIGIYYFHILHKIVKFFKLNGYFGAFSLSLYYFIFSYQENSFIFGSCSVAAFFAGLGYITFKKVSTDKSIYVFSFLTSLFATSVFFLNITNYAYIVLPLLYMYGLLSLAIIFILFNPWNFISDKNKYTFFVFISYMIMIGLSIIFNQPLIITFILVGLFLSFFSYLLQFALQAHILIATGLTGTLLFLLANYFEQIISFFKY